MSVIVPVTTSEVTFRARSAASTDHHERRWLRLEAGTRSNVSWRSAI